MKFLSVEAAAAALAAGEVVVMPTDTVYGVGVAVGAVSDPGVLFRLKGRDDAKPVAWLVEGPAALDRFGTAVHPWVHRLARRFWPGGLTLVVPASEAVPAPFRSPEGTIGLRMPASPEVLALIRAVGCPLAVTSANLSGAPAAALPELLDGDLVSRTAGVLGGACGVSGGGLASTVIDCTTVKPSVLRCGPISSRDLEECSHD